MRKTLAAIACASDLTVSAGNVWAATQAKTTQKKRVVTVTRSVTSPLVDVDRWGQLELSIKVNVTTTTIGTKKNEELQDPGGAAAQGKLDPARLGRHRHELRLRRGAPQRPHEGGRLIGPGRQPE
jgi:hypothetical protein